MPDKEAPLNALQSYLPEGALEPVMEYLTEHKVHLTVTRARRTILGNYQHKSYSGNHKISVNGTLNKYSFLITLLHELAHLLAFEKYSHRIQPHGKEWKAEFGKILHKFIHKNIFPHDIETILLASVHNQAASSCADEKLMRVLRNYDVKKDKVVLVEELPVGSIFKIKGGRVFKKGEKVRKRYKCVEVSNQRVFLFSPVYEVQHLPSSV